MKKNIVIIGGGPSGLMAAETLSAQGLQVDLYDAMPSVGRKFLLAGVGGMNITHSEAIETFTARYGEQAQTVGNWLADFSPQDLRDWAAGLGVETFVGSSGKVFPKEMKAAPLLRAWLHRLREAGVRIHVRHRWLGWANDGALCFTSPAGEIVVRADATVLALGGGSWAKLGSDGRWTSLLAERGVALAPLRPANCGFDVGWSEHLAAKFAGAALKSVALTCTDLAGQTERRVGEFVLTQTGIEGNLVYAFSARLRDLIEAQGSATFTLDLLPQKTLEQVRAELMKPRGADSLANHLRRKLGIEGVRAALVRECLSKDEMTDMARLADGIKALPVSLRSPRPLDEAISTAGGVRFAALDEQLMLNALPGVFCCGEMLDWEAPTGGYLLTACLASGRRAAAGVTQFVS